MARRFGVSPASRPHNGSFSLTPKPRPQVLDPIQQQCVTTNTSRWLLHFYNQHNQNPVIVLPGDIIFNVISEIHEHTSNGTLILRSLPALNALLREMGPKITPIEIWERFKYLGVCAGDAAWLKAQPLLRVITLIHSGIMRVPNIFDDVSRPEPGPPRSLPRYAYLWLRPFRDDPVTGRPVPYVDEIVPLAKGDADDGQEDAGIADTSDPMIDSDYDPRDGVAGGGGPISLAEVDDPFGFAEEKVAVVAAAAAPELPDAKALAATAAVAALSPDFPRSPHKYYWQYVPVCSTHPDLLAGEACVSAARRRGSSGIPFRHYDYGIFLGLMIAEPQRGTPNDPTSLIVQYATHGPFGSKREYQELMYARRHRLKTVDIDTQSL
jgi:hypothetical protein